MWEDRSHSPSCKGRSLSDVEMIHCENQFLKGKNHGGHLHIWYMSLCVSSFSDFVNFLKIPFAYSFISVDGHHGSVYQRCNCGYVHKISSV